MIPEAWLARVSRTCGAAQETEMVLSLRASLARTNDRAVADGKLIQGRYELVSLAGEGGMAKVWRALMRGAAGFTRPVAVKQILPQLGSNHAFVAMFVEEARVGSQLLHPNIVQIIDFGEDENRQYFLVMEWVEGMDLGRYLEAFRVSGYLVPWPLLLAIAVEALRGLVAAHERIDAVGRVAPVIHRDVTPQNILVGANGVVKLSDFGLARAMDRARMTQPNIIKGKLRYLAPEATMGNPPTVQSDLFSLGVVLWEALAGRNLYDGATDLAVFQAAQRAEIPPLRSVRADLPAEVVVAVEGALAREPAQRYESARAMLRALTQVLRGVQQSMDALTIADTVRWALQVHAAVESARALQPPPPGGAQRSELYLVNPPDQEK
jgi:eukaryotic-like serine/threonine-protein kinase